MKHLIIKNLILLAAILFFGCTEDDILVPSEFNQSNDATISLEKGDDDKGYNYDDKFFKDGDYFEGVCKPYAGQVGDPENYGKNLSKGSIVVWYDDASDDRVKGISTWYVNTITQKEGVKKFWGKAELLVDNDQGKWKLNWHGYITPVFDGSGTRIGTNYDCIAVGRGTEGDVKGLVAKWHYLMEIRKDNIPGSIVYNFTGTIK